MDSTNDRKEMGTFEPWEWQGDDHYMQRDPNLDFSPSFWGGVDQNEDDLLCIFDETTPVKDCMDFDSNDNDNSDYTKKGFEECRESSQIKRRRMLQFSSDKTDPLFCNEQIPSAFLKSKEREKSLGDQLTYDMQWTANFSDDGCTTSNAGLDQSSEGWFVNCFNDDEMNFGSHGMNFSGASENQAHISEFCSIPSEMESVPKQHSITTPRSLFKVISGRKAFMRTPTKLATPVAYPFALIKPCGVQGSVTLKDINQRIQTPPPRSRHLKDEETAPSYPTSAFSGKPVVVKTKILTEGGKGSITIMRTKG